MLPKLSKMSKSGDGSTVGSFDSLEVRDESNLYGTTQVGTTTVPKNLLVNGNITATGTISGGGGLNATTLLGKTWAIPDPIGSTTPSTGSFTTLGSTNITGPIGSTTPSTGAFTTLSSTASIQVSNPSTTGQLLANLTQPNLVVGQDPLIVIGKSATNFDSAVVQFEYNGAASTGNLAGLGPYGAPLLTVDGLGNTNVGGNLTVTGTINGGGPGGLNASTLLGKTWASPDPIGSTTPSTGAFTSMTVSNPAASATYTTQTNSSSNTAASTGFKAFSDSCNILMETTSSTNTPASRGRVRTSTDAFGLDLETQGASKNIRLRTNDNNRLTIEDEQIFISYGVTNITPNINRTDPFGTVLTSITGINFLTPSFTSVNSIIAGFVATCYIGPEPSTTNITTPPENEYSLYVDGASAFISSMSIAGALTCLGAVSFTNASTSITSVTTSFSGGSFSVAGTSASITAATTTFTQTISTTINTPIFTVNSAAITLAALTGAIAVRTTTGTNTVETGAGILTIRTGIYTS